MLFTSHSWRIHIGWRYHLTRDVLFVYLRPHLLFLPRDITRSLSQHLHRYILHPLANHKQYLYLHYQNGHPLYSTPFRRVND